MAATTWLLGRLEIDAMVCFRPGLQFVEVARNLLCTEFLQNYPAATDLFFIDDDVGGWPREKVIEFINRPELIVAGVYPYRTDNPQFPVKLQLVDGKVVERNGLYLAAEIPAGFMRLKREVVEHFAAKSQTFGWLEKDGQMKTVFSIFERGIHNGEFWGEDAFFSARCHDEGIEMWIDPDIKFKHRGSKAWEGRFKDSLDQFLIQRSDLVQAAVGQ